MQTVDVIATMISAMIGVMGGTIWLLIPPVPEGSIEKAKRIFAGLMVGFLWHIITGTSPIDSTGNWDSAGVITLLGAGYGGLAILGSLLPKQFDAGSLAYNSEQILKNLGAIRNELPKPTPATDTALTALENIIKSG